MNNEYENIKQDLEEDWTVGEPNFHSKQAANAATDGEVPTTGSDPQNQANSDDWAMNTMVSSGGISSLVEQMDAERRAATAPNTNPLEEKPDEWKMPEPVFRVSSGKKVEKPASAMPRLNFSAEPPATSETSEASEITDSVADIQPQPYISEALIVGDEDAIEVSPAKVKSKAGRTVFIIAGILAMVLFAASFLIGIYFLVFRTTE